MTAFQCLRVNSRRHWPTRGTLGPGVLQGQIYQHMVISVKITYDFGDTHKELVDELTVSISWTEGFRLSIDRRRSCQLLALFLS